MTRGVSLLAVLCLAGAAVGGPPMKAHKPKTVPEAEQGEGVSLTVYNQNFVVVRERRILDLKKGSDSFRFADVPATIVPETVQFTVLGKPDAARVVEQSYEFDLVSAAKLLERYIDRAIAVVTRDGGTLKGKLLSFDDGQLVLQTPAGVELVPRGDNVRDVQFSELPEGLLTRPTLVWELDSKKAGKELVKVAYAAGNMTWRVDYRARLNKNADRLDLAGWVTVTNHTGTTFKDAQLKLMAGDLNIVPVAFGPDGKLLASTGRIARVTLANDTRGPAITEKGFAEYHLYELGRKTTLPDRSTKQIELLDIEGVPVKHRYVLYPGQNRVTAFVEFKNDEKLVKGLGVPLPKGPARVFQRGHDDALELVGKDEIDHTPRNEPVKLRLGHAFDLAAGRKTLAERGDETHLEYDYEIRLRNHKKEAVTIDVTENVNARLNWKMLKESHQHTKRDVGTIMFSIPVEANAEAVLRYTIRYELPQ